MKTNYRYSILLLTIFLFIGFASPKINSQENKVGEIFNNRDDALRVYQNGLKTVLDVIPVKAADSTNINVLDAIKNTLYPNIFWGYIDKAGKMYALTSGHKSGLWVLFTNPDHPGLKTKSSTLWTGKQDSLIAVTVRPDLMTERWAGIFLIHELVHGLEKIYMKDAKPEASEYLAYMVEMDIYNLLTHGKLNSVLDNKLNKFSLKEHDQLLELYDSNKNKVYDFIYSIDKELNEPKPKSSAEEEMRIGFYLMAATIRIGQNNGYPTNTKINNLNQLLKKSSLYKVK